MKKNPYLFCNSQFDPLTFFKMKNADLRNPNIIIDYRCYSDGLCWKAFVDSFITTHSRLFIDNGVTIGSDFVGFIFMYYDTVLEKDIIITDPETIISKISE